MDDSAINICFYSLCHFEDSLSLLLKFYNHNEIHGNNKVHLDADGERYICLLSALCLGNKFTDQQETSYTIVCLGM